MNIIILIIYAMMALCGEQHDQIAVNYYSNCAIIVNNVESVAKIHQDESDLYLIHLNFHDDHTFIIVLSTPNSYASYEITPNGIDWIDF